MRAFVQCARLKHVCKHFKQVIEHNAWFTENVVLTESMGGASFESLLVCLRCNSTHVKSFDEHAAGSEIQAALGALAHPSSSLSTVSLNFPDHATLHLLPALKHITSCILIVPLLHFLDLLPIQALDNLKELHLAGADVLYNLQTANLTPLCTNKTSASAACNCKFVSCLERLQMISSDICKLHSSGLTACKQLQSLTFKESEMHALDGPLRNANTLSLAAYDDELEYNIPENMRALTALLTLELAFDGRLPMDLVWILPLNQLQTFEWILFTAQLVGPSLFLAASHS